MTLVTRHHELRVYRQGFDAAQRVYELSRRWPAEERYALTGQICRSSRAVCANIAEAWRKRRYEPSFVSKLTDADAEAAETQTWLDFAKASGYLDAAAHAELWRQYDAISAGLVKMMAEAGRWCGPAALRETAAPYHHDEAPPLSPAEPALPHSHTPTLPHPLSRSHALALDAADPLAPFRAHFLIADPDLIYLDGNSLGRLPRRTAERLRAVVEHEWGARLIRGWGEGWFTAAQRLGAKLAALIGARPDEVVVADSTSVNLFKLVMAALGARPGRRTIVTDDLNFPSDLYVLQGAARLAGEGCRVVRVPSADGLRGPEAELAAALGPDTALLALTHTAFKSGWVYDMPALTAAAHRVGALALWDLSHSVGALPVDLNAAGVDLAVGCTYKYLNGGPGAPAFLYVRRDLQDGLLNPMWGWFGQQGQFDMGLDYAPAPGVGRFLVGTPPMLSLAAVEPAVDLMLEAGLERLRAKSVAQTEYLITLWEAELAPLGMTLNSPREAARRGSHVSLGHPEALRIDQALIAEMNVIPDFRYPDNLRLGLAPLYTSFADIHEGVARIRAVIEERRYEKYPLERPEIT